jgi:hypothetical protein
MPASIQFGVSASPFGAPEGWVPRGPAISVVKDRANVLNGIGNEVASVLHNQRTEVTQDFEPASASVAPTIPPQLGVLLDEVILTSIAISTSATGFVTMTLTGHQHATNAHTDTLKRVTHGVVLSKSFGAEDFFGATPGLDSDVESSSITIACQHIDVQNGNGNQLVGENFDARISGSTTWHGVPTINAGAGWDVTNVETTENNTGFVQTTVTAEKPLTLVVPT